MYCIMFLDPPLFTCTKMMAHPNFFSGPPPPVLYDQSLSKEVCVFQDSPMFWPEVNFKQYTETCSCLQCNLVQKAVTILQWDELLIILIRCDVRLRTLAKNDKMLPELRSCPHSVICIKLFTALYSKD